MKKEYSRIATNVGANIYQSEDKDKLVLVPVNRKYEGNRKKPIYYLKRNKAYLSGLFATTDPAVFSGDIKHKITGIKQPFTVTFKDEGQALIIEGVLP